jgi:hypothetical protein
MFWIVIFIALCAFSAQAWIYRCWKELVRIRAALDMRAADFARLERKTDSLLGAAGLLGKNWPGRPPEAEPASSGPGNEAGSDR